MKRGGFIGPLGAKLVHMLTYKPNHDYGDCLVFYRMCVFLKRKLTLHEYPHFYQDGVRKTKTVIPYSRNLHFHRSIHKG